MNMKKIISALLILLMIHTALPAETYLRLELDNHGSDNSDNVNGTQESQISKNYEDDMVMGYFMAIGPGIIVHGAGNMYAGKWPRGLLMFHAGLLGLYLLLAYAMGENRWEEGDHTWYYLGALTLFFGSYAWDIATVGGAIRERHPEGAQINFGILPGNDKNEHMLFGMRISF
jgi:hypothetical protein